MTTTVTLPYAYSPVNPANNPVLSTPVTLVNPDGTPGGGVATTVDLDQTTPGTTNGVAVSYIGSNAVLTGNGVSGSGSIRVNIASDNTAFAVNANQNGTWNINNISGTISLPTGAATAANQPTPATAGSAIPSTGPLIMGSDGTNAHPLAVDSSGNLKLSSAGQAIAVAGTVSAGSSDSGNPVKVGGYANSTPPSAVTNGQRVNGWFGLNGQLMVEQAGASFSNITTGTTTTVKSGAGILHKIIINTQVASATITIYDNTAGSGTKIGIITLPSSLTGADPLTLVYDLAFATGLTLVTSGATDLTVVYR